MPGNTFSALRRGVRLVALTASLAVGVAAQAVAQQQKTVTGRVTHEAGSPAAGVTVLVRGTSTGATTNAQGDYSIRASVGQTLQFRLIGTAPEERTVTSDNVINVVLKRVATSLDAVVVTALGQTTEQRAIGTAQQTVAGADVAQTQRPNFVNALQGRVAGVEVTSTSGVPGASSVITIRGVTSVSGSNSPLMIVDGLPIDNKTINTNNLISASQTAFDMANRQADFTNRAADLNPEDIESITVLKGPEAAALYGIDAANGAIVITTKRGRGVSGWQYNNSVSMQFPGEKPEVQRTYGLTTATGGFTYFGAPYAAGTTLYDNVDGFFRTGDIGRFDNDGHLFITGRLKEMLIIGGENVFPREIEEVLNQHEIVGASGVVGKQDPMRGELPVAFVELREGVDKGRFDEKTLQMFCRGKLAGYKVPDEIRLMETLPRNPTGKVLRRELKKLV